MQVPEVQLGVYRHFKNGLYEVTSARARDANADEFWSESDRGDYYERLPQFGEKLFPNGRTIVVYDRLNSVGERTGDVWVRTAEDFAAHVSILDPKIVVPWYYHEVVQHAHSMMLSGIYRPRFEYLGSTFNETMVTND